LPQKLVYGIPIGLIRTLIFLQIEKPITKNLFTILSSFT